MPHTNSIKVEHPNGIFYAQRARVLHLVELGRAYWKYPDQTVLVILSCKDDEPANGYEYGGKKSYDRHAAIEACDLSTRKVFAVGPRERLDRTGIPVREPGGAKVLQLKPLYDRRTTGQHVKRSDRLYHPDRNRALRHDHTAAEVHEMRKRHR